MKEISSQQDSFSDVIVVGAGPAGMAAAIRAHESGAQVLVVDDNPTAGGQIWRGADSSKLGSQAATWLAKFRSADINLVSGAQVISADRASRTLVVETSDRTVQLGYRKLILATGAREIFLPFPGWTLPGIMGVGGLQALAKGGLPIKGKRIAVAGSGPLLLAVAAYLGTHGAHVVSIAEQASRVSLMRFGLKLMHHPAKLLQAAFLQKVLLGIPYRQSCWMERAEGSDRLRRVWFRQGDRHWSEGCDYAAIAYGLTPNNELASLLGCQLSARAVVVNELQMTSTEDVFCAGEGTGIGGVDLSLVEGEIAGYTAAGFTGKSRQLFAKRKRARRFADALNSSFALREELKLLPRAETIVCRCEDVTYGSLQTAASFRGAKLQLRCGMGPCQGRICGAATEFLFGWKAESIRPPIFPARIASLAAAGKE